MYTGFSTSKFQNDGDIHIVKLSTHRYSHITHKKMLIKKREADFFKRMPFTIMIGGYRLSLQQIFSKTDDYFLSMVAQLPAKTSPGGRFERYFDINRP